MIENCSLAHVLGAVALMATYLLIPVVLTLLEVKGVIALPWWMHLEPPGYPCDTPVCGY